MIIIADRSDFPSNNTGGFIQKYQEERPKKFLSKVWNKLDDLLETDEAATTLYHKALLSHNHHLQYCSLRFMCTKLEIETGLSLFPESL